MSDIQHTHAMTLPTILAGLAARLPERFSYKDWTPGHFVGQARYQGEWHTITIRGVIEEPPALLLLEAACREECESRGWQWSLEGAKDQCLATVYRSGDTPAHVHPATAPTPAEALSQALLAALEAKP